MRGVGRGFLTGHTGPGRNPQGRDAVVAGIDGVAFGVRDSLGGQMMHKPEDFAGQWELRRSVRDHLHGQHGTLRGRAVFTATDAARMTYEETGTLRLENGATMEATRRYLWEFAPDAVVVTFADGRSFHQFVPSGHGAGTDHPCGEDFYTVRYDFTRWPQWTAEWTVKGPRKDYVSTSVYVPSRA